MAKRTIANIAKTARRADDAARAAAQPKAKPKGKLTDDSYQNFMLSLGIGTDNPLSASMWGYNPVTRDRTKLEWMHRGSWIVGAAVDLVADDMTRAGVELEGELQPDDMEKIDEAATSLGLWGALNDNVRWSRLYGGCVAYMMIDGQDPKTPLRIESIGKGQFKGLIVFDRWMIEPTLNDLVTEAGPNVGMPKFYRVVTASAAMPNLIFHHSRCIRLEGERLPYWQRLAENLWGLSVVERLYDRLVAFDSATTGASQLVYKSFLRTLTMTGLREAMVTGGDMEAGIIKQVQFMRRFQSNESISVIDGEDKLDVQATSAYAGISDLILQFGQQISGALQIPLVRLFGQSPAGLNSTGESDLRTYYDGIMQQQVKNLKVGVTKLYRVLARSLGIQLPKGFGIKFRPLWQMSEKERSEVAESTVRAITGALEAQIMDLPTAMMEMRQASDVIGIGSNITEDAIEKAKLEPPPAPEMMGAQGDPEKPDLGLKPAGGGGTGSEDAPLVGAMGRPLMQDYLPFSHCADCDIVVENPPGSVRRGVSADGAYWDVVMPCAYGYIRGTSSAEGPEEQMDCFVGDALQSEKVWVVHQKDLKSGAFDEHKCMLGFNAAKDAMDAYCRAFSDGRGRDRIMKVEAMDARGLQEFLRAWPHGMRAAA